MKIYDLIGIGIGPFNLGLAALSTDVPNLDCLFIDQVREFNWHAGLLLRGARMQVPYYADLVSLADPTNRFSYLNYLKSQKRLLQFGIHDQQFPLRIEYNAYCQWVAAQLPSLRFGCECVNIQYTQSRELYVLTCWDNRNSQEVLFHTRHLVIGVGTVPSIPEGCPDHSLVFHAGYYLSKRSLLLQQQRISVIGSGQSAAEIFYDLLCHSSQFSELHWLTRSRRFYPMDYSKLSLEMSTPDYIRYFHGLPKASKKLALVDQQYLFKGINATLIDEIYDELYVQRLQHSPCNITIQSNCLLEQIKVQHTNELTLSLRQTENETDWTIDTDAVVLATGYSYHAPCFLQNLHKKILRNSEGTYAVNDDYSIDESHTIFVQNADLHSHGFNSADLGLGPYRNAVILNAIVGQVVYSVEKDITFQKYGSTT